jgi:Phosphotransferase enzyme family
VASDGGRPFLNPAYVRRLLHFLEDVGFDGAPRYLGIDPDGKDRVSFEVGWTPEGLNWGTWTDQQLQVAFRLLRRFHDSTAGSPVAEGAEVACHNDFAPPNLVFRDGPPHVMIDWEWAAPGTRRHDLGHAIWQWLNLDDDGPNVAEQTRRLRLVLDAYGLEKRDGIVDDILKRQAEWIETADTAVKTGNDFAGRSTEHWTQTRSWVARERRWLLENRPPIEAGLT